MSLHLAASLSYDVVILAFTGYFTAVCLDLAYKAETVKVGDVIVLAVVMAVMGPCKMVYGAIAGFCLLVPVRKFEILGNGCFQRLLSLEVFSSYGSGEFKDSCHVYTGK